MAKRKPTKAKANSTPITSAVLRAIDKSGMTRYEIAKRSGVTEAALSHFVNGNRGLTLASVDQLAPVLGLELTIKRPKR